MFGLLAVAGCVEAAPSVDSGAPPADPWYAAYVDVTVPSSYRIDDPPVPAAANAVLAFVVADGDDPCTPSWGNYYSLDEARTQADLDGRIARVRKSGGDVAVSFGGARDDELATVCRDETRLAEAYRSVIDRYQVGTIDLDIEGDDLEDQDAGTRRAAVIAQLQHDRPQERPLHVWLTLPAEPTGLTGDAEAAVSHMLEAGVELAGVNIMAMNYGDGRQAPASMLDTTLAAAQSAHRQLGELYGRTGRTLDDAQLWGRIGLTPMNGHNDFEGQVTGLDTARGLNEFARSHGVARLSMWSLNRDRPCSEKVRQPSDTCSGVAQEPGGFSRILGYGFAGSIR